MDNSDFFDLNKNTWNSLVPAHLASEFYDNTNFILGKSSLKHIELPLLGDVKGKKILHFQCHFGQDSISLARMGAEVTAVDLSDKAIDAARDLAQECKVTCNFICSNIYDLKQYLNEQFDIVFISYGAIIWLPDLSNWAELISYYLKPSGKLIMVEFHPIVFMFDDGFKKIKYSYFNDGPVIETYTGSYADKDLDIENKDVTWNHSISEIVSALIDSGLSIASFQEYDHSPYNCFEGLVKQEEDKYFIEYLGNKFPLCFSLVANKI